MSAQLLTIVAVVAGGIVTGGSGFILSILQHRWTVRDTKEAWRRERQDRLFEKKQEAHLAFLDAVHEAARLVDKQAFADGDDRRQDWHDLVQSLHSVTRAQTGLEVYASRESTKYATATADALTPIVLAQIAHDSGDSSTDAVNEALELYVNALRADLSIDAEIQTQGRRSRAAVAEAQTPPRPPSVSD